MSVTSLYLENSALGHGTPVKCTRKVGSRKLKSSSYTAAHLRALIESSRDLIWSVDLNYHLITFNKALSDHFIRNYGIKTKAGMRGEDMLPPDRIPLWPPLYERALKEGPFQTEYRTVDGRYLELNLNPIVERGKKTGVWVLCKDITARKAAQQNLAAAVDALKASEARYRVSFQTSVDAVSMSRLSDRTYIDVNNGFIDIFGFQREEVLGRTLQEIGILTNPSDEDTIVDLLRRNSEFQNLEIQYRAKNGETIWGLTSGGLFEVNGATHMLVTIRNISEHKAAQEALKRAEEQFRVIFEDAPEGIFLTTPAGKILAVNPASGKLLGYSLSDNPDSFIRDMARDVWLDPRERAHFVDHLERYGEIRGFSCQVKCKDGSAKWVSLSARKICDADGKTLNYQGFFEDLTSRMAAEDARRNAEERYREIFEHAPEGIFQITPEGKALTLNPALVEMLGYESEAEAIAAIQDPAHDLFVDPSDHTRCLALLEQRGSVRDLQRQFKRKDGAPIWVSTTARKVRGPDGKTVCYQGFNRDITEQKRLEAALQANNRELQLHNEINNALVRAKSEKQLLEDCCRIMVEIGGYRMAWVGSAADGTGKPLVTVAHHGCRESFFQSIKLTWVETEHDDGPVAMAMRTGKVQVAEDISADPLVLSWRAEVVKQGCRIVIALPFRLADGATASLAVFGEARQIRSGSERSLMEQIASQLGYGIESLRMELAKTRHQENLRAALEQTIHVIAETVDRRDPYTAGHERRVADLCMRIAQKLGLPEERTYGLFLAASIHDLGKIGIPAEILSKPGPLTPTQHNLLKEHVQLGYDILKDVAFPWPIADLILQHHERLDGSGYPHGLKGDAICLQARVLAVADVVEAMSSHRPYRAAQGIDAALDEIIAQRGKFYDAQVADACVRIFREDGYSFPA